MADTSRKFPNELDCPIDNFIIKYGSKMFPFYKTLNMNPNHLTTLSLVIGLLCIYAFKQQYFVISSILYFISYCYDVLDGNYARKYNMVTKFGDLYDHIKDISINILLLIIFYKYMTFRHHTKLVIFCLAITILLFITLNIHLGCQEIYVSNNNKKNISGFLSISKILCTKNIYNNLHILKYFGSGVFIIWISFLILVNNFF